MSTSLLYHGWGLKGYRHVRSHYGGGKLIFTVQPNARSLTCPVCHGRDILHHGSIYRMWREVSIGSKPVFIQMGIPRIECRECSTIRQVKVSFADQRRTYTRGFERYALELSRHMTIIDVARHLNVGWDLIKDIQKRFLHKCFSRPKLKNLRQIAIDEISIAKGQKYLTVVLDLDTGCVVFVGDGNGAEALQPFWRRLRRSRARIEAVAMDMSKAYISAVTEHLPAATIVFDHFHVIKLFNDKLQEFRRQLFNQVQSEMEKKLIKGTRWLLLKNPENLVEERDEPQRLQKALQINQPLATVYYMKEDLRQLWSQKTRKRSARFLADWMARARVSGICMLEKFADTLQTHRDGILAYYDYPISTGPLEGTNNKIKTMKRQAYGFRDKEFFKLKIMGIHLTKYALVGWTVDHHQVFPSFAYRFNTPDGSIVISGDTGANTCGNLKKLAQGADILVHEVIDEEWIEILAETGVPSALIEHLNSVHTKIGEVGGVAEDCGVRTLVLNHIVPGNAPVGHLVKAKQNFSGELIIGRDLMQIGVGKARSRKSGML